MLAILQNNSIISMHSRSGLQLYIERGDTDMETALAFIPVGIWAYLTFGGFAGNVDTLANARVKRAEEKTKQIQAKAAIAATELETKRLEAPQYNNYPE